MLTSLFLTLGINQVILKPLNIPQCAAGNHSLLSSHQRDGCHTLGTLWQGQRTCQESKAHQGLRKKEVFQCKWEYQNWQRKVKTEPSKAISAAPIIQELNLLLGAGQGDNTCTVFPVYSVLLLQSLFSNFHHSDSLEPIPHPGLLICGMINPGDKAFCAVSYILGFFVLALSVLPFLLISSETHGAENSKEAQRERSVSEVIAQCRRRLKLQQLQMEKNIRSKVLEDKMTSLLTAP